MTNEIQKVEINNPITTGIKLGIGIIIAPVIMSIALLVIFLFLGMIGLAVNQ